MVVLVTLAFFGLSWHIGQSMLSPVPDSSATVVKGETSRLMVLAMALGLLGLVVLGVHPPASLDHLLNGAAAELGVPR